MAHVIVVGSGIAGLSTALHASARHDVTLVTKGALADSNTRYAQGGIAAATALDDSATLHAHDTIRAGAGLTDETAARVLADDGAAAIQRLIAWGVQFDHRPGSAEPERALEAAHSRARVLHAGGDATGAAIEAALVAAVRASGVAIAEHTLMTDLVLAEGSGDGRGETTGRVVGIEVLHGDGSREVLLADAVVLATGGAGQLFSHTTNPAIATGDGLAAALRAGVATADLEFYQFHPTTLAAPGNFLVSEAVRGEGAVLRNALGERFMIGVHPDAELAPRDVVARAIAAEMAKQNGVPVTLDARGIEREALAARFPTIMAACAAAGFDLAGGLVPVVPAAHYYMGGIATDLDGRTSHAGLYAVGEAACTGVHGANRLASNSLLEGAVFARRVAAALAWDCADRVAVAGNEHHVSRSLTGGLDTVAGDLLDQRRGVAGDLLDQRREVAGDLLDQRRGVAGDLLDQRRGVVDRAALQELLWHYAGLQRSGVGLATAAARLRVWAEASGARSGSREEIETANLLVVAQALVAAARARHESRGAHSRTDHPQTDRVATREAGRTLQPPRTLQTQGH
jgi:L-aspartate oxidase